MDKSKLNCPPGNWTIRSQDGPREPKKEEPQPQPAPKPPLPQGTAMWREDKIVAWNLDVSECSTCLAMVPQSQLSVCTKATCEYALKTGQVFSTPTHFFNAQKRFCGQCTNYRSHCGHREFMKQALPLAISTTSVEAAVELHKKYTTIGHLDQMLLLDFVMEREFEVADLSIPKFDDYLSSSLTSSEWMAKKERVEQFLTTLADNREKAKTYVEGIAKETVDAYRALIQDTEQDYERKDKRAEDLEFVQKEHTDRMKKGDLLDCHPVDVAHLLISNVPSRAGSIMSEASMAVSVRVDAFHEDTPTIVLEEKEQEALDESFRSATPPSEPVEEDGVDEEYSSDESSESILMDETREIADVTAIYVPPKPKKELNPMEICQKCKEMFDEGRGSRAIEDLLASISDFVDNATSNGEVRRVVRDVFKLNTGFSLPGSS